MKRQLTILLMLAVTCAFAGTAVVVSPPKKKAAAVPAADTLTVSGGTPASANGTYTPNGTFNGQTQYRSPTEPYFWCTWYPDLNAWVIYDTYQDPDAATYGWYNLTEVVKNGTYERYSTEGSPTVTVVVP